MESMDPVLETAIRILRALDAKDDVRLIGGLAVRLTVGDQSRLTHDVDLVVMTDTWRDRLLGLLRDDGYQVGAIGGWWRAMRPDGSGHLIDIAEHPVVEHRTFVPSALRETPAHVHVAGSAVAIIGQNDLARLKLLAGREQDLVDLALLATRGRLSAPRIADGAERDDTERAVSAGLHRARFALRTGGLSEAYEECLGRRLAEADAEAFQRFLDDLAKEGL
jgi:predicted nucleotidyltransferase